jgi:hypothetical protein
MYKQDVGYPHNGILFSRERNKSLGHAATWMILEIFAK